MTTETCWSGDRPYAIIASAFGVPDVNPDQPRRVITHDEVNGILSRICGEVLGRHPDLDGVALIGIRRRGVPLAERLQAKIKERAGVELPLGILDINFYRDDFSLVDTQPVVEESHLDFDVNERQILLVDDVLFTGRTVRAALESISDYGRPRRVELVVLVDRGHRELPIQADYTGRVIGTTNNEMVEVRIAPVDETEGVFVSTITR